jgi:hypothetical protein
VIRTGHGQHHPGAPAAIARSKPSSPRHPPLFATAGRPSRVLSRQSLGTSPTSWPFAPFAPPPLGVSCYKPVPALWLTKAVNCGSGVDTRLSDLLGRPALALWCWLGLLPHLRIRQGWHDARLTCSTRASRILTTLSVPLHLLTALPEVLLSEPSKVK